MFAGLQYVFRYAKYYLTASNGKGHGVHSPFVFDLIIKVLNDSRNFYACSSIEKIRAGKSKSGTRKFDQLLFRIADYYAPDRILEIGATAGVTTAYLAAAKQQSKLISLAPDQSFASTTHHTIESAGLDNVTVLFGEYNINLEKVLQLADKVDLVFFNDLRPEELVNLYTSISPLLHEDSMVIVNDIHINTASVKAWETLKNDIAVTLSIDLFNIGILVFRKENRVKQHFAIRF